MKNYRLHWDAKEGWVVDTDIALSDFQLKKICDWATPRQVDRWRSLPPGEKKDELGKAIKLLQKGAIRQRVVYDRDGVATAFKSNASTGKIISVGGI